MNDEPNNNQSGSAEPTNEAQVNSCADCKKNPCVCPNKSDDSHQKTLSEEAKSKKNPPRTKPPKISWI